MTDENEINTETLGTDKLFCNFVCVFYNDQEILSMAKDRGLRVDTSLCQGTPIHGHRREVPW